MITEKNINEYFQNKKLRHYFYDESVNRYDDLNDHYVNKVNMKTITDRRPNEGDDIKAYREKIAVPVTKRYLWKIISYLSGIRKAKDWNISWDTDLKLPASIAEDESLEDYLEYQLPIHSSLTNWAFSNLLTQYVLDANAIVFTAPDITKPIIATEFVKPYPVIYNSDMVIDYKVGEFYVLKNKEVVFYSVGNTKQVGCSYTVVTNELIDRYDQTSRSGDFELSYSYVNKLGRLPIHHLFGVLSDDNGYNLLCESRLSPMVPYLKEAMRFYTDFQAETVQHVFSQYWTRMVQDCSRCKGTGQVISKSQSGEAVPIECKSCGGQGSLLPSPFQTIGIKKSMDGTYPQGDPAGYIQKNIEVPKLLGEIFEKSGYAALSSVNFQNVDQVPTSQSGVAKEVDREQQNITMHAIAEDIVRVMDLVSEDVCDWRYIDVVPDQETREEMLPEIAVPDRFDLTSAQQQMQDIQTLVNSKADPAVINAVQMDFLDKYFASNPKVAERAKMVMQLNPFVGKTAEEVGFMEQQGMVDSRDAKVFSYLPLLIDLAIEYNPKFSEGTHIEKLTKLRELAITLNTNEQEPVDNSPANPTPPVPPVDVIPINQN